MSAQPKQPFVTPEEYLAIERAADFKSEYFSGEMFAMSGASHRHESIVVNLTGQLYSLLRGKPCQPNGGNLRVRAGQANYLYPDLTIVCGKPEFADGEYLDTLLNPTVIFEILSQSTELKDRGLKWILYQQLHSVQHYVLIHQDVARVEVYTRQSQADWQVHTETGPGGTVLLPTVGLGIAMADLYENVPLAPEPDGL